MKEYPRSTRLYTTIALMVLWVFDIGGCSTSEVTPIDPPHPPAFTQVPHPSGPNLVDITALFTSLKAPKDPDFSKTCDRDFRKLEKLTSSKLELQKGAQELVQNDPVFFHWCFYGKILALENELKSDEYLDVKQKRVLEYYAFLIPIARSFIVRFHDSRYLRCATQRYQRMSEWVFYRKLQLSPAGTLELVQSENPFGLWKEADESSSILSKYNILTQPVPSPSLIPDPTVSPSTSLDPTPGASISPLPNPTPSLDPSTVVVPSPNPS